ncbi:MAG: hypothetical protein H8Z69_00370 [Nanohaloarchaea archaeon]|nr:hypothetical protein [Candidatus Nanohaloarchaea archaeon]
MKGQFMLISSIVIGLVVIGVASTITEVNKQDYSIDDTAYVVSSVKTEAAKAGTSPKARKNFKKAVGFFESYSTTVKYWDDKSCYNVTMFKVDERLEMTCIG